MAWQLVFTDSYVKTAVRFLRRHPELKSQYAKTLALLEANPHHPSLRLHALKGRVYAYRITLELMIRDEQIIPTNVGGHDEVY